MSKTLTTVQKRILDELAASPLAWVGHGWGGRRCIVCPANGEPWGFEIADPTFRSLMRMGLLRHGELSEEQQAEYASRMERDRLLKSVPTHGYLFKRD